MPVQKQETAIEMRPYRLGVALSGGGARGFAHAGALKAIEEAGLKPDIILHHCNSEVAAFSESRSSKTS